MVGFLAFIAGRLSLRNALYSIMRSLQSKYKFSNLNSGTIEEERNERKAIKEFEDQMVAPHDILQKFKPTVP